MQFRIADTFTSSLGRLPNDQQRAAKTTAFDLQTNPSQPGLGVHKLTNTRDPNFWSARVNLDLRIISHRAGEDVVLCYAGRHDDAYRWAERRKLETHPTTGAAQLVELREVVQEITVPVYVETPVAPLPKPPLFARIPDDQLLGYGVPAEWLDDVRLANEDSVLDLADHLPSEAAEALLELAVGKYPQPSLPAPSGADPFDHPDRFAALPRPCAMSRSWPQPWSIPGRNGRYSSIPSSRQWSNGRYNGPARVSGSAGTGKTVVALHRVAYLARVNPSARVLLTTFSDALARLLQTKLELLVNHDAGILSRITVRSLDAVALDLSRQMVRETPTGKPARRGKTHRGSRRMAWQQFFYYLSVDGMGSSRRWLAVGYMGGLPWHPTRGALSSALRIAARDAVADIRMGQVGIAAEGFNHPGRSVWAVDDSVAEGG